MLVEAGFDVYLANSRGNRYSREHVILKPNEPEFWKWSWQEMAKYDLPATIDIVLETSNKKNLYYIGHSQGKNPSCLRQVSGIIYLIQMSTYHLACRDIEIT